MKQKIYIVTVDYVEDRVRDIIDPWAFADYADAKEFMDKYIEDAMDKEKGWVRKDWEIDQSDWHFDAYGEFFHLDLSVYG